MKRTKIIATVGPVTETEEKLKELYDAWVNIIRFNFSHANYEVTSQIANRVKKLNSEGKTNLSLLLDTKGPEIRTWDVKEKIKLTSGDSIKVYVNKELCTDDAIFCDYPYLLEDLDIGDTLIVDSWLCNIVVKEKFDNYLIWTALNTCELGNRRHINLPWVKLKLPWITDKDRQDVMYAIENDFDFIAMSFVRNKENIAELRTLLKEHNAEHIKIISKVENQEAIENLDEIIENSDWVMAARWDLWVEVPVEKLPFYQKQIVDKCRAHGKFFVIATHMLETMIENPFPTRAEVSDIYNAVMQQADCTMLSWETTIWKYPIDSVSMMTKIIIEAEKNTNYQHIDYSNEWLNQRDIEKKLLIKHGIEIAEKLELKWMVVLTKTWLLARLASAFRPKVKMYAFTHKPTTLRFMNSLFWIKAMLIDARLDNHWDNLTNAIEVLKAKSSVKSWDRLVAITDIRKNDKNVPVLEIITID